MKDYPNLSAAEFIVLDTETDGLHWHRGNAAFGAAVASPEGDTWYYDLRKPEDFRYVADLCRQAKMVVNHNIKFDIHMLRAAAIQLDPAKCRCTMVAAALINEHERSYSLDSLATKYADTPKVDIWPRLADIFGGKPDKKSQIGNLPRAPKELVAEYAKGDTLATLRLWDWQRSQLTAQELWPVYDIESKLLGVLVRIEQHGVRVDVEAAERRKIDLGRLLEQKKAELDDLAGRPVNANSSPQIASLLIKGPAGDGHFEAIDGSIVEGTESGNPSVGAEVLRKIDHPIAKLVVDIRSLDKTINTFLAGHILGQQVDGRVHANYNQTKSDNDRGTGTGRLSVNDPALQQIHKRDKGIAQYVRSCFVPDHKQRWCSIDWSQMDFRVFAHYANEPGILRTYRDNPGADFHGMVASMAGIPRDRAPGTGGGNAKQINLGLVFGMSAGRMAQEMGLPFTEEKTRSGGVWKKPGPEAEAVFEKYHEAVPGVKMVLDRASALAKSRGYVRTILGRRIRFPDGAYHKAAGLVFQGSAADALKLKLVEIDQYLTDMESTLLLNVHDEFDLSISREDEKAGVVQDIQNIVEDFNSGPIQFRVPIRSSVGMGDDWWEASK